jgi:hypothetical protein
MSLDKVFDVAPLGKDQSLADTVVDTVIEDSKPTEDADFDFARKNYYKLLQQANDALVLAMKVASSSEHPRAIEVLSGLMKNVADVNKQLITLSKDNAEAKAAKKANAPSGGGAPQLQANGTIAVTSNDINKILADRALAKKNGQNNESAS